MSETPRTDEAVICRYQDIQDNVVPADFARQLERENAELRRDAEKWRALIGCARITAMGSAGIERPNSQGYAHITLNFWTHGERETEGYPREWLEKFVDAAGRTPEGDAVTTRTPEMSEQSPDVLADAELRRCQCLMKEEGMSLVCDQFLDDDHGDCMTCGHRSECHERP